MKYIKLLLVVSAILFVFGACGNGGNEKEDTKEATVTSSPDLTYWELKGPVKTCDYVEFDRQGKIVRVEDYDPFALEAPYRDYDTTTGMFEEYCQWTRDDQGQIASILSVESLEELTWVDGRVSESLGYYEGQLWLTKNEYDAEGNLVKQSLYNGDEDAESEEDLTLMTTTEYTYLEFDSRGNWIRRKVKSTDAVIEYVNEEEETRTIEYYE